MSWLRLEPFTVTQTEKEWTSLLCKHMSWLRLEPFTAAPAEKDLSIFIGKVDISSFDLTE